MEVDLRNMSLRDAKRKLYCAFLKANKELDMARARNRDVGYSENK